MTDDVPPPQTISDEGSASYLHGLPRDDCPYPPGADERDAWLAGWDREAAKAT